MVEKQNFIVWIETDDTLKDFAEDVEIKFAPSNNELNRPLQKVRNIKAISVMNDKLNGKVMLEFLG